METRKSQIIAKLVKADVTEFELYSPSPSECRAIVSESVWKSSSIKLRMSGLINVGYHCGTSNIELEQKNLI